jgi:hypothetical protein
VFIAEEKKLYQQDRLWLHVKKTNVLVMNLNTRQGGMHFIRIIVARTWWCMPVIPATWR